MLAHDTGGRHLAPVQNGMQLRKYATKTRTVLLLDEVGLAEHLPDMPLKVLHGMQDPDQRGGH